MPVQNAEIAAMFDQAAELLEIQGESQFRVRAYRRAARLIQGLPQSVRSMIDAGVDLSTLPGIGKDLAGKISDIIKTGRFALLDTLKKQLPGQLAEISALPGLGPKRVKLLYDELNIRTLADLERSIKSAQLQTLRGFGPELEKRLMAALKTPPAQKRFKLSVAEAEADALKVFLGGQGDVTVAGSYRRRRETVGDLDIVIATENSKAAGNKLVKYDNVAEVISHGATRSTVVLRSGLQVDLRAVPKQSYGAALLYFTGSKDHNIALRSIANDHGWKLNEYGLFAGNRRIAGATETEIYKKLGLAYIPPELREDRGEIPAAAVGQLPHLISGSDTRGDLHVHSNWTDGTETIAEMANAARQLGYEYIAITDHSRRISMAHGLDPARLTRQGKEIDSLNKTMKGFTILKGIEVDILKNGTLDLPDSSLAKLDIVVAAVHSYFDLPRKAQTERIIRAINNPHVKILGHPTGRLIGERDPYEIDIDKVIAAARDAGCCLEVNAEPDRLDLNGMHAHAAKLAGVKLAISTDAHSTDALRYMRFGIDQARRGWLTATDVINTKSLSQLRKFIRQ